MSGNMHFIHCVVQDIPQYLDSQVDLILSRVVLEWMADLRAVLKTLWSTLHPGDALSLMSYNANGLLMRSVLVGNLGYVQQGMYKKKWRTLPPDSLRDPRQVYNWLEGIGWEITGKTGVRVFHDYLRDK